MTAATSDILPAAFFDRDGVLNVDVGYTHGLEELALIPGVAAAVRSLNDAGYRVLVVTNQSGVARGYYSRAAVGRFNARLQELLAADGARIDAFYDCPHHPQGTVKEFAIQCNCRKPAPGLLQQAAREWPIDMSRSFLIGDKDDDLAAAVAFGIRGVKFDASADFLPNLVSKEIARMKK